MADKPTIVIDTREQRPWQFDTATIETVRQALPAGDYSIIGLETQVAVERKSLEDYVSTIIHSRDRFRRELQKLATYDRACVVVEAGFDELVNGLYRSAAHPNSVVGLTLSICVDHGVPVYFCYNRDCARRFAQEYLLRFQRSIERA